MESTSLMVTPSPPKGSKGNNMASSLAEQRRLQAAQEALKARLAANDIFDDSSWWSRLHIRYRLPDIGVPFDSKVTDAYLERTFSEAAFTTATFNPRDRRWRSVLRRGYGLVATLVGAMLIVYSISATATNSAEGALNTERGVTLFWVGLSMRLTALALLGAYLCVLRFSTDRGHVLAATVAVVWTGSFCTVLAISQDEQLASLSVEARVNATAPAAGAAAGAGGYFEVGSEVPGLPMLVIMAVYVAGVPGLPFAAAMLCGWGQLPLSLLINVSNGWGELPWGVSLSREGLFCAFGTFVAYSQIQQMKRNHLQRSLLDEAAQLEKGAAKRMESLTHNTVPKAVAEQMIGRQDYSYAASYEGCTVLQSDIVGYTALMGKEDAMWVLNFVSEIFEEFDQLCEKYAVDKIKTIGDAYVVCAGALTLDDPDNPHPQGSPPQRVVRMALDMQTIVQRKSREHQKEVGVRIGVHTGWTAGGNIGTRRPHFDIWGPGVTNGVKMEEMGRTGLVHVSDATHAFLGPDFECRPRRLEDDMTDDELQQAVQTLADLGIHDTYFVMSAKPPSDGVGARDAAGASERRGCTRGASAQAMMYLNSKLGGKKRASQLPKVPSSVAVASGSGSGGGGGAPGAMAMMQSVDEIEDDQIARQSHAAEDDARSEEQLRSAGVNFDIDEAAGGDGRKLLPGAWAAGGGRGGPFSSVGKSIRSLWSSQRSQVNPSDLGEDDEDDADSRALHRNLSKEEKLKSLELAQKLMGHVLRSRAIAIALVYPAFALYDVVLWTSYGRAGRTTPLLISRAVFSLVILAIALLLTTRLQHSKHETSKYSKHDNMATLRLVNLALVVVPACGAFCCILLAPDSSTQYMFALSLFQIWTGYSTLNLPTKEIAVWQILITIALAVAERTATMFDRINALVRPEWEPSETQIGVSRVFVYFYLAAAQFLGIWYNRVSRHRVNRHAKQQVAGNRSLADSQRSLIACQSLLESVFPKVVFAKLQEESDNGESLTACESFQGCTFLFAKIVGLNKLTAKESGVEPADVVQILQLIFDRFDSLADLFLVQKVRKTVYESYMLAAGLPDRAMLEGEAARAHAVVSLAGVMVSAMEIINHQLPQLGMPASIKLSLQIGIHSGGAIAGIMGHKRFQYDLCGDDVNVAARMMGGSAPKCINVSETTYALVRDDFDAIDRGERFVKGKGMMRQYFIIGGASTKAAKALEQPPSVVRAASALLQRPLSTKGAQDKVQVGPGEAAPARTSASG